MRRIRCIFLGIIIISLWSPTSSFSKIKWLKGFEKRIAGEVLYYHSPLPMVGSALLVRSLDRSGFIEWETEPIPEAYQGGFFTFMWMAGIDVNEDSHTFRLFLNDKQWFAFSNPLDTLKKVWCIEGRGGSLLRFQMTMVDKYDDLMGYVYLKVPRSEFEDGKPITIRVEGESAGSRTWYMTFQYRPESRVSIQSEPAIVRKPTGRYQPLRIDLVHMDEPCSAGITVHGGKTTRMPLEMGYNTLQIHVSAVQEKMRIPVRIEIDKHTVMDEDVWIEPVPHREIYLLHHSHVDIGYTHVQTEVERMHWAYFERAVDLARRTKDYPVGARFKWNSEVMWAVESYTDNASPKKKQQFIEAIQSGWIGLDGLYANELTGLCRPEELMRLLDFSRHISNTIDIPIDAAMITDIPGYTWGLVPALAQSGIRYLSIGPNWGHRIGYFLSDWADRPFYWVSPSGEEKVLCWVAGKGYSWFHTGLDYNKIRNRLKEKSMLAYLSDLEKSQYPYSIVGVRYNIGSDNGPPDPMLPDIVKQWNEKYITPRVIIATTGEMFRAFEEKYGPMIPSFQGDLTGHWEDGAGSSSRETAMNRQAAERLVQAEALWVLHRPEDYPAEEFREAWRNVLLYDEHTWGSWNSISDPEGDFTKQQWEIKKSFTSKASEQSEALLKKAFKKVKLVSSGNVRAFDVYNTLSWHRTDLVVIPKYYETRGDGVIDDGGNPVPSQRLTTGELAFLAKHIPPLGFRRFYVKDGSSHSEGEVRLEGLTLSNGLLRVNIDEASGAIAGLKMEGRDHDFVNRTVGSGLNDYVYVAGRKPENPLRIEADSVNITVKERGSLIASIMVESDAPGTHGLKREIRLVHGINRVELINEIDKKKILDPEGVHMAFPFQVEDGQMRLDVAWGVVRPEYDQLPGSCKNYFTVQRWVDISNQKIGMTWATPDAPLIEVGGITTDPIQVGWKRHLTPTQTFYSYVMNNYWETNYKAAQEGPSVFRYAIGLHGPFDSGSAERFGTEYSQPLIVVPVEEDVPSPVQDSFLRVDPIGVVVTSLKPSEDGQGIMLRLYNAGGRPEEVELNWGQKKPSTLYLSSPFEEKDRILDVPFRLSAYGIVTIRAEGFN